MNRTLSKVTLVFDFVLYIVSGFLILVSGLLLTTFSGGVGLLLVPGALLFALACLIAPNAITSLAQMTGFLDSAKCAEIVADRSTVFKHVGILISEAFKVNPSKPAFAVASISFGIAFFVGLIGFCMFGKMFYNVESPMDWFVKHTKRYVVYSVFCVVYAVAAVVGSLSVLFSATGGVLAIMSVLVLLNSVLIALGLVFLFSDRKKSCATYATLSTEEQIALCDKQSECMKIRQRKKQIKKLGEDARFSPELLEKRSGKKPKNGKKNQKTQSVPDSVVPVDD